MRYALVDANNVVVNVIELEDGSGYQPPQGLTLVQGRDFPPAPTVPLTPLVPEVISDRQFFQQLAIQGVIQQSDALAAVRTGVIPTLLQTFINSLPSGDQQFQAEMFLGGATQFMRHHPMTLVLAQGMGWTDAQLDALWTAASAL